MISVALELELKVELIDKKKAAKGARKKKASYEHERPVKKVAEGKA